MLASAEIVLAVRDALNGMSAPVVVDPVMVATSGDSLATGGTTAAMPALFRLAALVTPNVPELAALAGREVHDETSMLEAAQALAASHGCAILAKGGHLSGPMVVDLLVQTNGEVARWAEPRIDTRNSHGTGCTLSSAIATGIGGGKTMAEAISTARAYVRAALLAAPGLGRGHGPMGHGLARTHFPVA